MPTSCVIVSASSSDRAWRPSATFWSSAPRSFGAVADQLGNARAAAWTARSMSSREPAGTVAKTSSVVESKTSSTSEPAGATQAPSM